MTDLFESGGTLATFERAEDAEARRQIPGQPSRGSGLRVILIGLDWIAGWVSWFGALILAWPGSLTHAVEWALPIATFMAFLTVLLAISQRLYQARVCNVRSVEVTRLGRVAALSGVAVFAVGTTLHDYLSPPRAALGALAAFLVLTLTRAAYAAWLKGSRSKGHFARRVCIVGESDEAEELVHLFQDHPELGYCPVGVIGADNDWMSETDELSLFGLEDPVQAVMSTGATGVILTAGSVRGAGGDALVRDFMAEGLHVQIAPGLSRVGHNRVRMLPLGHYLTLYVEPHRLSTWQSFAKRAMDLAIGSTILFLTLPITLVAAVLIKLEDRGPVFYKQNRIGKDGKPFEVFKLRTMVPDASSKLLLLTDQNEREGPLFKLARDPRVTRIGHLLRTTSIDELPQLLNVLGGQMSLVGPRPALASEVAKFDADLLERSSVPPGITGLWQVEARDNPSFRAYRRLDLFYVDNWSIGLDIAIMAGTARLLLARVCKVLWSARPPGRGSDSRERTVGEMRVRPD